MSRSLSVSDVVRGGFWLYASSIVNNVFGFIYWSVISRIGGSTIIGLTSATIGLASLVIGVLALGTPIGLQRFLGRERRNLENLARYFWSTASFLFILYLTSSTILYFLGCIGFSFSSFRPEMFRVAALIVLLGFSAAFNSLLVSMLRTDVQFFATLIGNVLKLVVGVMLVLLGFGWIGAALGYVMVNGSMVVIGLLYAVRNIGFKLTINFDRIREVLVAGLANWLPGLIVLLGNWIGVLAVFGTSGAIETGYYYIAFVISNFILAIGTCMLRLLLPVLSGLEDGRKRASYQVLRIALSLVSPIAVIIAIYPYLLLGLLGKEYIAASTTLTVLLLSAFSLLPTVAIYNLVYAYGWYRDVLVIGLLQNIPRLILYYLLTPMYGGLGTAIAYTIGSYIGLVYVVYLVFRIRYYVDYHGIGLTIGIPVILAILVYVARLPWYIGGLILLLSYLAYTRLGILTRRDLRIILEAFISRKKIDEVYSRFRSIIDFLIPY